MEKKIKELRLESGATQLQLGEYAGCSGQVISNIERGYTNPSAAILKKDIGILSCSFRLFIR
ncbi:MAG: helix-turn-helix transcriptional regulator [Sellimonas intestinalis]|uniref:helix-turn-helix transcriptional regulator n=1 Tax=Sellimonas intestinalis TaxID=1653434 RepID=UPI003996024F